MHILATAYHTRPSEILGISDEWAAYQLDVAAYNVGQREVNKAQAASYKKASSGKGGKDSPAKDAQPMTPEMIRALAKKNTP